VKSDEPRRQVGRLSRCGSQVEAVIYRRPMNLSAARTDNYIYWPTNTHTRTGVILTGQRQS